MSGVVYYMNMKLFAASAALLMTCTAFGADSISGNTYGSPKAPIMMEVFSDFQCPGCKSFHDEEMPLLMKDFVDSGKVYIIYRYFPLDMHPYGRKAADFVCAAAHLGKYHDASNLLFAQQNLWGQSGKVEETLDNLFTAGQQKELHELASSPTCQAEIKHDIDEGKAIPVTGTPFLMITHRLHRYPIGGAEPLNYQLLKPVLDGLLTK